MPANTRNLVVATAATVVVAVAAVTGVVLAGGKSWLAGAETPWARFIGSTAAPPAFVGSDACAQCHPAEAKLWRSSQHKLAMAGSLQLYRGLSLDPSAVIYGQRFGVDVAFADPVLGEPDVVVAEDVLAFAGIEPPKLRLYPVEQKHGEKEEGGDWGSHLLCRALSKLEGRRLGRRLQAVGARRDFGGVELPTGRKRGVIEHRSDADAAA